MIEQQPATSQPYDRDAWSKPPSGSGRTPEPMPWRTLILLALAVVVVGGAFGYWSHRHQQVVMGMDPAVEAEGREYMANLLRDPSSAQFRNLKTQNECLTGEVNGKTGFGGYAGFVEFYYIRDKKSGAIKPVDNPALNFIDPLKAAIIQTDYLEGYSNCLQASMFE